MTAHRVHVMRSQLPVPSLLSSSSALKACKAAVRNPLSVATTSSLLFCDRYQPAPAQRYPYSVDVHDECVAISVPAAVHDVSEMRVDGDVRPRTPRAVHLFSTQDVHALARSNEQQETIPVIAGISGSAIPPLPPSQYPRSNDSSTAAGTGRLQSMTAGARHRYTDEYERIERIKVDSQVNRDKRAKRMVARRAEILDQLQRSE